MTEMRLDGRRFVLGLYAVVVGIAGVLGFVLGESVRMGAEPRLFFLIPLPPTGVGFAVFGMVTVAVGLAIPLALVVYLSRREGVATAGGKNT